MRKSNFRNIEIGRNGEISISLKFLLSSSEELVLLASRKSSSGSVQFEKKVFRFKDYYDYFSDWLYLLYPSLRVIASFRLATAHTPSTDVTWK